MADVRVTAEVWQDGGAWSAHAYGGPLLNPVDLTVSAATEEEVRADFIAEWNEAAGTAWEPEEFSFVPRGT
jgi:hypothetical protein